MLAVYGYDSDDEELYQPAEQKYYSFNGWTDENGLTVESISSIERGETNLIQTLSLDTEAVANALSVKVDVSGTPNKDNTVCDVYVTIDIKDSIAQAVAGNSQISAIGLVLSNTQNAEYEITKEKVGDLKAPLPDGTTFNDDEKNCEVKLNDDNTAYLYAYGWANYCGTLTVQFKIETKNISGRYFKAWVMTNDGDMCEQKEYSDSLSYNLTSGDKAGTVANPGRWFYLLDSEQTAGWKIGDHKYENGKITFNIKESAADTSKIFQLRYQPEFEVGKKYVAIFTIKVSNDATIRVARDEKGSTKDISLTAGQDTVVAYEGEVHGSAPFFIQFTNYDRGKEFDVSISDISFSAEEYKLSFGSKANTEENKDTWYYMIDGAASELNYGAKCENGLILLDLSNTNGGGSYQFRYQPSFEAGANYTVTFKVKVTAQAWILADGHNGTLHYPEGAGDNAGIYLDTNKEYSVSVDGKVKEKEPFYISLKTADSSAPVLFMIYDVVFTAK